MKTEITPLEGGKVKLSVEVDEAAFDEAIADAFRRIGREVRIPGFRPGKVPRRVLEARIGADYARAEALQAAIPDWYAEAVRDHQVDVIAPPEIDLTSGQEEGTVAFDAVVEVRPELEVAGYGELAVEIPSPVVPDTEIDERVDAIRGQHADLVDVSRSAIDGDHVSIDITTELDGEAVPGLTAEDYLYEVGQGHVVPELDERMRGAKAGDILSFQAPHPSDPDRALDFRILVKQVKQKVLPELTDEWVADNTEFATVQELRADLAARMGAVRRFQAHMALREKVAEGLTSLVADDAVPEAMVQSDAAERLHQFAHQLHDRGLSLEQWQRIPGNDAQRLQEDATAAARSAAKLDLGLRAVARQEQLEVTPEDVEGELERFSAQHSRDAGELRSALESGDGLMAVRSELLKRKAMDWLLETVTVTDAGGAPIDRSLLELADTDDATDDAEPSGPDAGGPEVGASHDNHDDSAGQVAAETEPAEEGSG